MKILSIPQRSEAWFNARAGIPTASNFSRIVTSTGKRSRQRDKYLQDLELEFLDGPSQSLIKTEPMERGIILEEEARFRFELELGVSVTETGLILEDQGRWGCSPDGLIDNLDAGLEIKCPLPSTHHKYLVQNRLPTQYIAQVQGCLLVTGFKSWWFFSYCPGEDPLILEIHRNEQFIHNLQNELEDFNEELQFALSI